MKVCFLSPAAYALFFPEKNIVFGGAELQIFLLSTGLSEDDSFSVSCIVSDYGQKKKIKKDGVFLLKGPTSKSSDSFFKKIFDGISLFYLLFSVRADVYFTSTATMHVALVSLFCRIFRKKHIYRSASEREVDGTLFSGLFTQLFLWGRKNADCIFTQQIRHKKMLSQNYHLSSHVLRNIPPLSVVPKKRKNRNGVLWVGRCVPLKNPHFFLDFAQDNSHILCTLIAPKKHENEKFYFSVLERAQNIPNVRFIPYVSPDKIQEYFNTSSVFVNTSDYEGFPNTFLQAAIAGTPIVSLNVNPDNFLTKYNAGKFCNKSPENFSYELCRLVDDSFHWEEVSKNLVEYVHLYHGKKKNISLIKKILSSFIF